HVPAGDPRPDFVHFVVCAPSRSEIATTELAPVRSGRDLYGEDTTDWAPYRPKLDTPIVRYATTIAAQRSFQSGVADVRDLGERLDSARRNNQIVVLLVDAWTTRLPAHRQALAFCDGYDRQSPQSTIAVMVPSSADDAETQLNWRQLGDSVRAIFRNRSVNGD